MHGNLLGPLRNDVTARKNEGKWVEGGGAAGSRSAHSSAAFAHGHHARSAKDVKSEAERSHPAAVHAHLNASGKNGHIGGGRRAETGEQVDGRLWPGEALADKHAHEYEK